MLPRLIRILASACEERSNPVSPQNPFEQSRGVPRRAVLPHVLLPPERQPLNQLAAQQSERELSCRASALAAIRQGSDLPLENYDCSYRALRVALPPLQWPPREQQNHQRRQCAAPQLPLPLRCSTRSRIPLLRDRT